MNLRYLLHPLKSLRGLVLYWRIFGVVGTLYALHCTFSRRELLVRVSTRWSKYPLYVRLNTSDVLVFRQVFVEREYEIVEHINSSPTAILDGGANIGLTSIFFAQHYPQAKIFAVEPETANLKILRLNTHSYSTIKVIAGAIWNRDGPVGILSTQAESWAFRVSEHTDGLRIPVIQGFRVSTLMQHFGVDRFWLLKLDIEGAEYEVLSDHAAWIESVDNIVAELHESIRSGCEEQFAAATIGFHIVAHSRELVLACRPSA